MKTEIIFLISPYSDEKEEVERKRFREALQVTSILKQSGLTVYSPIVYGHTLRETSKDIKGDAEYWKDLNIPILEISKVCVVLTSNGWHNSQGVKEEIELTEDLIKRMLYVSPQQIINEKKREKFIKTLKEYVNGY